MQLNSYGCSLWFTQLRNFLFVFWLPTAAVVQADQLSACTIITCLLLLIAVIVEIFAWILSNVFFVIIRLAIKCTWRVAEILLILLSIRSSSAEQFRNLFKGSKDGSEE
jgi:hypothetical protein